MATRRGNSRSIRVDVENLRKKRMGKKDSFKFPGLVLLCIAYLMFICSLVQGANLPDLKLNSKISHRGVWITCFSEKKVLYSKNAVCELLNFCAKTGINEIYLQLYRAGRAYYNSQIADSTKYEEIVKSSGTDTIAFLLQEANKKKIKVFAWLNVLSLSENKEAAIAVKFGDTVFTKDQYLRLSSKNEQADTSDKYYLRENQLFLEPGDPRVGEYILSIIDELLTRYPALKGIHLDYVRYPYAVPYLPDSRFNNYGLSYGYGEENMARFKQATGLDPLTMPEARDNCLLWDNWKREQITALVQKITQHTKVKSADLTVSCAVIPYPEQAYSVAFQDWPLWVKEGIIDYVVLMSYTKDNRLFETAVKSALAQRGKGQVFVGIGAFLLKTEPKLLDKQYKIIETLKPDGIVFFSYDDL